MGDCFSHLGLDDRERRLAARFAELARLAGERDVPRYTAFLDEREQAIAACARHFCPGRPWGGFEGASRAVYGYSPYPEALTDDSFPVETVLIRWRKQDRIGHRDILGTLMSLQIKRETVGDILVGEGEAVVFCLPAIASAVSRDLVRIGGTGVSCSLERPQVLPAVRLQPMTGVAASLRLDCLVAMVTAKSRSEAVKLIRSGKVARAGQTVTEPSREMAEGESLSVRGYGKYVLRSVGAATRSGRYHVSYEKYI